MAQSDYVCRVCLAEGAWNIFSTDCTPDEMCTVASINYIQEKLQYVTQLELHENDGLPLRICELCIIQLNVAYRFKLLATESDNKLRQCYELSEFTTAVLNALTNSEKDDVPEVQTEPEVVMVKVEEFADEITIEPKVVIEECTDSWTPVHNGTPVEPCHFNGMVYLQKDIINPAQDEAYLKEIINKEIISIPLPNIHEKATITQNSSTTPTIPPEHSNKQQKPAKKRSKSNTPQHGSRKEVISKEVISIPWPNIHEKATITQNSSLTPTIPPGHSNKQQKPAKKRSKSNTPQHGSKNRSEASNGKTEPKKSKPKVPKKEDNQSTTPKQTPKRTSSGSVKKSTKPIDATLRKRRLEKVLNHLRIDMMYNNTVEWHNLPANVEKLVNPLLPIMPMKRRNSICVSSFAPRL